MSHRWFDYIADANYAHQLVEVLKFPQEYMLLKAGLLPSSSSLTDPLNTFIDLQLKLIGNPCEDYEADNLINLLHLLDEATRYKSSTDGLFIAFENVLGYKPDNPKLYNRRNFLLGLLLVHLLPIIDNEKYLKFVNDEVEPEPLLKLVFTLLTKWNIDEFDVQMKILRSRPCEDVPTLVENVCFVLLYAAISKHMHFMIQLKYNGDKKMMDHEASAAALKIESIVDFIFNKCKFDNIVHEYPACLLGIGAHGHENKGIGEYLLNKYKSCGYRINVLSSSVNIECWVEIENQ